MPEEIEVDVDKLRETIDEVAERGGQRFLRRISLTTAILAALAAIASLEAGATVNEALVLKTEATRLQAEASDQWAYYQAKGIKAGISKAAANAWLATGKSAPQSLATESARYTAQQDTISKNAQRLEHERDERSDRADALLRSHEWYAASVAFLQISIALGAIAALTRSRATWFGSITAGLIGVGVMLTQMFQK